MRIWCQLPLQFDCSDTRVRRFFELIENEFSAVKREETEIRTVSLAHGIYSLEWLVYPGIRFVNEREIVRSCLQGEAQGYDGIIIANYFDSGLRPTRQLSSLPVVGFAESTMHFASIIGNKFAVIVAHEQFVVAMEKLIDQYGLRSRAIDCRPVRSLSINYEEIMSGILGDSEALIRDFQQIAHTLTDDGAEVIIAGGGLFSVILSHEGLREIDGAPVLDPFGISLKACEMMVDLKKASRPVISRKRLYFAPPPRTVSEVQEAFFIQTQ